MFAAILWFPCLSLSTVPLFSKNSYKPAIGGQVAADARSISTHARLRVSCLGKGASSFLSSLPPCPFYKT